MWHPLSAESDDKPWRRQVVSSKSPLKAVPEGHGEMLVVLPAKPLIRLQPDCVFRELAELSPA